MNEFKLKDIESFSYYGFDPNLRISNIILNIIKEEENNFKKCIKSISTY